MLLSRRALLSYLAAHGVPLSPSSVSDRYVAHVLWFSFLLPVLRCCLVVQRGFPDECDCWCPSPTWKFLQAPLEVQGNHDHNCTGSVLPLLQGQLSSAVDSPVAVDS